MANDTQYYITAITYIFFIYLVMALFIERFLEILVAIFNYISLKCKLHRFWNRKAYAYRDRFERLFASQGERQEMNKMLLWVLWRVITDKPYAGGKEIISASLIRLNYVRIGIRFLSLILSFIFVLIARNRMGFDLICGIKSIFPDSATLNMINGNPWLSVLVTSIAVSLGSEPLHQLINKLEDIGNQTRKLKGGANDSL